MEDVSTAKVCDEDGLVSRFMTIEAHGYDHEGANLEHSRDQQHRVRHPHADAAAPLHDDRVLLPCSARVTS